MALDKFRDPADPAWEQRVNGLESGSQIEAGAIGATQLATGAVTEAKIAGGAVTEAKLGTASVAAAKLGTPLLGGEPASAGEVKINLSAPVRKIPFCLKGAAGGATTKYTIKHGLTEAKVWITVYKNNAGAAGDPLINATGAAATEYTFKTINTTEAELIFGKAPAENEVFWGAVFG